MKTSFWHPSIAVLARVIVVVCLAGNFETAAQGASWVYWTSDQTVGPGHYSAGSNSLLPTSASIMSNGGLAASGKAPVTLRLQPGTCVEGGITSLNYGRLEAKGCHFRGMMLMVSLGGAAQLEDCAFEGAKLRSRQPTGAPASPAGLPTMKLVNSVFSNAEFYKDAIPGSSHYDFKDCTFYGCTMPDFTLDASNVDQLNKESASHCRFVRCTIPASFFLITRDCVFEDCSFEGVEKLKDPKLLAKPLTIHAQVSPAAAFKESIAGVKACEVTLVSETPGAGGTLKHKVTGPSLEVAASTSWSKPAIKADLMPGVTVVPITPAGAQPPAAAAAPGPAPAPTAAMQTSSNSVAGTEGAQDIGLKVKQGQTRALLLFAPEPGSCRAANVRGVTLDLPKGRSSEVVLDRAMPPSVSRSLQEAVKFLQHHYSGWPAGYQINISLDTKDGLLGGGDATLPVALVLNQLITGRPNDPLLHTAGELSSAGELLPVSGMLARLHAAATGSERLLVALPAGCESSLSDLIVMDGPAAALRVQCISVANFEDVLALAGTGRGSALEEAMAEFARIQEVAGRDDAQAATMLRNSRVQEKLMQIQTKFPAHASVKALLSLSRPGAPATLSLPGSFEALTLSAGPLVAVVRQKMPPPYPALPSATVDERLRKLKGLRLKLPAGARKAGDALITFAESVRTLQGSPSAPRQDVVNRATQALNEAADALTSLMALPDVAQALPQEK